MRKQVCLSVFAFPVLLLAQPLQAGDRSLVILFGPATAEHTQQAVPQLAAAARNWLAIPGAAVELRRPGVTDGQQLARFMSARDVEAALLDAARVSSQIDVRTFLDALDRATYAAAHQAGSRALVIVADNPPLTPDGQSRVQQAVEFCRSNAIHVLFVDPSKPVEEDAGRGWRQLAANTGGVWMSEPRMLDANLLIVAPVARPGVETEAAKPALRVASPLHARFVRTRQQWSGSGIVSDVGPAHGLAVVEMAFSALRFNETDRGGGYMARARVTSMVKNDEGKIVWQAKKDITVKGPAKRLEERRSGNLYFVREIQLPGGKYTVDAQVEDLLADKSWTCSEPLKATVNLPGFSVSDAIFVRELKDTRDKFESDTVIHHESTALVPLLAPAFRAGESFVLQLYFLLYPDPRGGQPQISMEVLHGTQSVARSELAFNDRIRDTARENQDVGAGVMARTGEQKSEFPYLASILDASFSAGQYEARVTIRQDRNTVTRTLPFVVTAAPPAQ